MTREDWRTLWHHMRMPVFAFVALILLLAINVVFGIFLPFRRFPHVWTVEAAIAVTMVLIVLIFSMELIREPPLMGLFSAMSFFWVAALFSMTLLDYLTR